MTDGVESAFAQAKEAAGDNDIAIAGGAAAVRQYLKAGLVDELHLHVVPLILGRGEKLLDDVGEITLELMSEPSGTDLVTHLHYRVVHD